MKKQHQTYRIIKDKMYFYFTLFLSFVVLIPLVLLIIKIIKEGIKYINLDLFFSSEPSQTEVIFAQLAEESIHGGIANGIVGIIYILLIALALAIPIGVFSGIFFYTKRTHPFIRLFLYVNDIVLGIPSIITGLVIYLWIVRHFHSFSALAGGIAIAIIIFPFISRCTAQSLSKLPIGIEESCVALGARYSQVIFKVLIPSIGKKLTGYILHAAARGLGETAPLLFTAWGASVINWHINRPTSTLSLQIWSFFNNPYMIQFMWSAIFILFIIILILHVAAKVLIGNEKLYNNE